MPHAGEAAGPESVRDAVVHLRADRIGHGIRAVEDPRLLDELAAAGTHLEVCPTSNLRTRVVASLDQHPLPALVAAGIPVSISSDDPPMFGTPLTDELDIAGRLLGADAIPALLRSAIGASYAPQAVEQEYLEELAAHPPR